MTKDDIIKIAQESGWDMPSTFDENDGFCKRIEKFANLVAAQEREACAKFVESGYIRQFDEPWRQNLAAAIRAKGGI